MLDLRPLVATPNEAKADIAELTRGRVAETGKITIELPEIAENGNTVPLSITVDRAMTAESHVTDVLIVATGNPRPGLAVFHFTPMSGRAQAAIRIRLAATQDIVAVARTSDGKLFTEQKQVKVTIGGCGGCGG